MCINKSNTVFCPMQRMQNLPRTHQDTPEALPYTAQWKQLKTTSLRQKVRENFTYLHQISLLYT